MRLVPVVVLIGCFSAVPLLASEPVSRPCLMQPVALSIDIPASGFTWLPGGDISGTCDDVPSDGWSRRTSVPRDLYLHTDGPEGSGRFWTVAVAVSEDNQSNPIRGVCITTSTVGWRTLRRYSKGPLPWLDDVDDDGRAEFILWDSFPLHDEASMADYALVAWVYRLVSADSLVIDWDFSRGLAGSLANEYRSPLDTTTGYPGELRAQAAGALEQFAEERCCDVAHTEAR